MTVDEKFAVINALREAQLCMRKPGDWYVSQPGVDAKEKHGDGVLTGRYGNGETPAKAIEDHFDAITARQPLAYLVISTPSGDRKHVKWNGFMWQEVQS